MIRVCKKPMVTIGCKKPKKIFVVPDMQIKPNIDLRFVYAIGRYVVDKQPDILLNMGDMADMPSLSSYDKGKKSFEGKRYKNDIESVVTAQEILFDGIKQYNAKAAVRKDAGLRYEPQKIMLLGNHEDRIHRAAELDPMLEGTMDLHTDLKLYDYWDKVYDFLRIVEIQGAQFSHYFTTGVMGRPCGTAQAQLASVNASCISGHQPGRQTHTKKAGNKLITSIIAGSSYLHDLDYMGAQGNIHWRGVIMLHNAVNGSFDEVYIPIQYLIDKYCTGMGLIMYSPKRRRNDTREV